MTTTGANTDWISLKELLARQSRRLSVGEALYIAREAASRLGGLHGALEPQCLLISLDGDVKVTGGGLAPSTMSTSILGSTILVGQAKYSAPELFRGKTPTSQSDAYAIGAILWEMIYGRTFLDSIPDAMEPKGGARYQMPTPPRDPPLPENIAQILRRALTGNLSERYPGAADLAHDAQSAIKQHFPVNVRGQLANRMRGLPQKVEKPVVIKSVIDDPRAKYLNRDQEEGQGPGLVSTLKRRVTRLALFAGLAFLAHYFGPGLLARIQGFRLESLTKTQSADLKEVEVHLDSGTAPTPSSSAPAAQTAVDSRAAPQGTNVVMIDKKARPAMNYAFKVLSNPSGAKIYLNNVLVDAVTPITLKLRSDLPAKLLLRKAGFKDCIGMIDPKLGQYSCDLERK